MKYIFIALAMILFVNCSKKIIIDVMSGQADQYRLINGKKFGSARTYYLSGQIKSEKFYFNDTLDGPYYLWNEEGNLVTEHHYKMGKWIGTTHFFEDGAISTMETKDSDSIVHYTKWYKERLNKLILP